MKPARNIIVKTCLTADEFVAFAADCAAEDISHSKKLRDGWIALRNLKARTQLPSRPGIGQRVAKFAPGRIARPELRLRH